ncbi:hypothetical protein [uncultured Jatrophihabitans sp.]|uniref:hypothetical protein n=1 Tax=uncultured Jatrophihabitans sp. TaxID=1610747 RepID=UPI0035CA60DF
MTEPHDTDPLERGLRRSLSARADDAPDAHALTQRLLAVGEQRRVRHPWTTFGTPLLAAACVAAIVAVVLAIVQPGRSDHAPDSSDSLPVPVPSVLTPAPTPRNSSPTPSPTATGSTPALRNVRIVDLTFTSADSGWALASADCLSGSGRCTALLRSTDGTTWAGRADTPFDVSGVSAGCPPDKCVTDIRFATDSVGYAYGPNALFMTRDGAVHWTQLAGGADALETLNGNVIRLSLRRDVISVSTAAIGSPLWTVRTLSGPGSLLTAAVLVRTREAAYIVGLDNPAKPSASQLFTSGDDGDNWTNRGVPCPSGAGVISSTGVAAASNDLVALVCTPTSGGRPALVLGTPTGSLSVDRLLPAAAQAAPFVAAVSRTTFIAGGTTLYRTTDSGASWTADASVDISAGITFAGFETTTVGRLVTDGGRTIWTTRDAGATWTRADP